MRQASLNSYAVTGRFDCPNQIVTEEEHCGSYVIPSVVDCRVAKPYPTRSKKRQKEQVPYAGGPSSLTPSSS
ncbi:MAG: hypothetical protein ACI87E_002106 [Mariniblastus sp.]|jgi:hypothetical protein